MKVGRMEERQKPSFEEKGSLFRTHYGIYYRMGNSIAVATWKSLLQRSRIGSLRTRGQTH